MKSKWPEAGLLVAGALTTVLVARTLWYLFHSITNVPYTDQWILLDEIRRFRQGALAWNWWWAPYWGQRDVVGRLLLLLDAKYFHFFNLPLILVNVAAQACLLAALLRAARGALCAVVFTHLVFSSLGMEVLVLAQNVQHSVGYAAAIAAILLGAKGRYRVAAGLGMLAAGCLAIGLVVFPILAVQAWLGKGPVKAIAGLTVAVAALYAIGYTRPDIGMGAAGALRHPFQALEMTSLILGGPISLYSLKLGTAAGAIGLAATAYFLLRARNGLAMAAAFLVASALSLALGRISPEWLASLHGAQPLPSRYIAPVLVFWGCLFALAIGSRVAPIMAIVSAIVLAMTFGAWNWQWRVSREWAEAMQRFDAIGSGFLVNVSDREYMSLLLADEPRRDMLVAYLRRERLSVFAEERAGWMDQPVAAGFDAGCRAVASFAPVGPGAFRVTGTLDKDGRFDVLLADERGVVRGLARTLPAEGKQQFLGYLRTDAPERMRVACRVR